MARASPKSVSLTRSTPFSRRMFEGLTSRWIRPCAWAAASPAAACMPIRTISASRGGRLVDALLERLAGDVLHHEAGEAPAGLDGVDRHDVLVADRRGRLRLAGEPPAGRGRPREMGRQDLDGDEPIEARVVRLEDHPHPAPADHFQDLIRPETADLPVLLGRVEEAEPQVLARPPRIPGVVARLVEGADVMPPSAAGGEPLDPTPAILAAVEVLDRPDRSASGSSSRSRRPRSPRSQPGWDLSELIEPSSP